MQDTKAKRNQEGGMMMMAGGNMTECEAPDDRDARLEKAVALVTSCRYSVRKAAHALRLPKSTVHRYLQATRGGNAGNTASGSLMGVCKPGSKRLDGGVGVVPYSASVAEQGSRRPSKCDISFLVDGGA